MRSSHMRTLYAVLLTLILCMPVALTGCPDDSPVSPGQTECGPNEELVNGVCRPIARDANTDDADASDADDTGDTTDEMDTGGDADTGPDLPPECDEGDSECFNDRVRAVCNDQGVFDFVQCEGSLVCTDGECAEPTTTCEDGETAGCADESNILTCNDTMNGFEPVPCPEEAPNCLSFLAECSSQVCVATSLRCGIEDPDTVEECNAEGTEWVFVQDCPVGEVCDRGECLSPCDANAKLPSFLGCDYYAVDLDNLEQRCDLFDTGCDPPEVCDEEANVCEPSAASQQFAVSISNPNEEAVDITITKLDDDSEQTLQVGPETSQSVDLARLDVNGTSITRNAYRINASLPITAHQFNPANNLGVFSNDASLLLPSNSTGEHYIVITWPTGPYGLIDTPIGPDTGNQGAFGYTTVVAVNEGTTTVTVTPTVDVAAGVNAVDETDMAAIDAGETATFELEFGEVLNLETAPFEGLDLSGTRIDASQAVSVFAGHECAFVPLNPLTGFCDHVEQQLFPVEAWGTLYVTAKFGPRGTEPDVWKVVAAEDGTLIRTDPAITGINGAELDAGEVRQFQTAQSFLIEGSGPILVGQFMVGAEHPNITTTCPANLGPCDDDCVPVGPPGPHYELGCDEDETYCQLFCDNNNDCSRGGIQGLDCVAGLCVRPGTGDPAFSLSVPVSQFRDNYDFLTPGRYRDDFAAVVAPDGTEIVLDGNAVPANQFTTIGASGYSIAYLDTSITDGADDPRPHRITGSAPFGLQVHGYDCDVSYAYPGGLDLAVAE